MATDWWSVKSADDSEYPAPAPVPDGIPEPPAPPVTPPAPEPKEPEKPEREEGAPRSSRSKAVKVVGGAAGAIIAGILVLNAIPGGGGSGDGKPVTSASARQGGGDLPAAGGGPKDVLPATDGSSQSQAQQDSPASAAPKVVTLTAKPFGKGRVGAVMKVTIHNGTDETVTVLATMMKGDGRPAVVGEGTLAPGSRTLQPGQTATGTVEFSTAVAPHQVALLDLSGNVMAASSES